MNADTTLTPSVVLCGEAAAGHDPSRNGVLCLRNSDPGRNVHLVIDDISRSLSTAVPPQFADLVEVATYVYVADQSHTRGGNGVEDMGANWRRPLHFEMPVRRPDLWRRDDVQAALRDVLSFLSEDHYTFDFREYREPPAFTGYLRFSETEYAFQPESVVLFSGGLDSLAGAVQEVVVEGRPVLLVTHQASNKFINRMRTLRTMLDGRATGAKPLQVSVSINKDERLNREYTQRSRSFLYASLGAAVARMSGLDEVRFYENGTVSLNLPISRQVVGAKATRTTHPRVLAGFGRLFSLLADRPVRVTNRFQWKTKAEVVRSIVDAGCGGMIEWSSSCTHTWELSNAHPHCGKCSQCIDRRFAVLAAGAAPYDPAGGYAVDLLVGERAEGEVRTMLASYVETARQVADMSETEFFLRFGEVARVVRQLGGPADEAARKVFELYRRHGQDVVRVLHEGLASHVPEIVKRSLPEDCLLRMVHDPGVPAGHSGSAGATLEEPPQPNYLFRPSGQGWQLRFAGHELQWLRANVGNAYLWELLRFPEKRFTVSQLLIAVHGDKALLPAGDAGEDLDRQAKVAFAQRLLEIDEDLEAANAGHDIGRQTQLAIEREELLARVKAAAFKTRAKRNNADLNRIRNNVCNAIRRAMARIKKYEPAAFDHLKAGVSLGFSVSYQPTERLPWSF
jgi:hypothetical protein